MLLSIIIPSFQQASFLQKALLSIDLQTFKDYEIIVMDGGSVDDTANIIASFKHLPLRFYSEPDKGIYDAMNKGISRSSGEYLYFMGCDDSLAAPDVLEKVFALPNRSQHVIYGDVIFTGNGVRFDGEFSYFKLYIYNICHQGIFTHRKVFEKLGNFNIKYKTFADWEFNMRWFDSPWVKRKYINLVIANYNTTGYSSNLEDDAFYAEQAAIKQRHFPIIVRYLAVNQHKVIYRYIAKYLTTRRVMALNFMRQWLE